MTTVVPAPLSFILKTIHSINEQELDALPYGVIQLDAQGTVLRYNASEEQLSGLNKSKVIGKNFFTEIAPCTDLQEFRGRFSQGVASAELHCTFRFHFAFKHNPCDVTVTLYLNRDQTIWVLVQPFQLEK